MMNRFPYFFEKRVLEKKEKIVILQYINSNQTMKTLSVKDSELLRMQQTIDSLQKEVVELRELCTTIVQYLKPIHGTAIHLTDTQKQELENRLEMIENGEMKVYHWNEIKGKYGNAI